MFNNETFPSLNDSQAASIVGGSPATDAALWIGKTLFTIVATDVVSHWNDFTAGFAKGWADARA